MKPAKTSIWFMSRLNAVYGFIRVRMAIFYRHGDSNREMSSDHLLRVGQSRSQARIMPFDEQAVPGTGKDTLQIRSYQRFLRENESDSEAEEILFKRRLLVEDDKGDLRASVAGVLMCHNKPDNYLYNSFIQAVCYSGKTRDANYQLDAKDFSGTLDQQILDAFGFVARYNKVSARKDVGREEKTSIQYEGGIRSIGQCSSTQRLLQAWFKNTPLHVC